MMPQAGANVEVSISHAMRDLFARQRRTVVSSTGQRLAELAPETCWQTSSRREAAIWSKHSLRRDGMRPLELNGILVASYSGRLDCGDEYCVQDVSLFVSQKHAAYLALGLKMPERLVARSRYQVIEINAIGREQHISKWCNDVADAISPLCLSSLTEETRTEVLCPIQIFGLGSSTRTNASEVVAFRFPGNLVLGFAVDAIQKIGAVTTGARAVLSDWHGRHSFIKDIMIQDDDTQVFALCIDSLYASADLCEIAKLSELEVTKTPVEKLKTHGERNIIYEKIRYLVVEAGNRVAVPLSEVNRIIAVPEEITVTVESSSGFGGYFAKSGQSIGLFDLSACHGHPHETTNHSKVLLTGSVARQSGFQVARVIGIELSEWREIQPKTAHGTAPALVQLGNGDTATVLPICSLTETLNTQTAKRPTNESLSV